MAKTFTDALPRTGLRENGANLRRILQTEKEVICLDHQSYVAMLVLGLELSYQGVSVAKITKRFLCEKGK